MSDPTPAWLEPTRLEQLAHELGIGTEQLRQLVRSKIAENNLERTAVPQRGAGTP
jgi:hypothetical protein